MHGSEQWCIAKNGGGYTQKGVAKGLKVPWGEYTLSKKPGGWYTAYTPQYTTDSSYSAPTDYILNKYVQYQMVVDYR